MKLINTVLSNNLYNVTDDNGKIMPHIIAKKHKNYTNMCKEVKRLYKIRHLYGVVKIISTKKNIIFLERIDGDDLFTILEKKKSLLEVEVIHIAMSLIKIVKSLHNIGIVHCDIKPENIMYNELTKKVTIIDFEDGRYTSIYAAPEIYTYDRKYFEADIWSIGVTVYTLCMGYYPYTDNKHIFSNTPMHPIGYMLSKNATDFIYRTIDFNYHTRLTIDECLLHNWFNDVVENFEIEEEQCIVYNDLCTYKCCCIC